jgi:hypothetical protein
MRNFWLGQHARRFAHGLHDGTERHHGRHHGHGEHRRRGGRVFDHGDLRLRTSRGPLSETEVDAIASALDTAARTIERI